VFLWVLVFEGVRCAMYIGVGFFMHILKPLCYVFVGFDKGVGCDVYVGVEFLKHIFEA
jgi:hypothetical protein